MPFLNKQVEIVNNVLRGTAFYDERFKSGRYEAIAYEAVRQVSEGKFEFFPVVMDENYEAHEVTVDDTYPIVLYHKVLAKNYSLTPTNNTRGGFGDKNNYQTETTLVKMVVYGKWSAIKLTKEQLEALIVTNFPDNISNAIVAPLKLDNMTVTLQSSNLKPDMVWGEEYRNIPLRLAPEDILFSINYTITTTYRKGCFQICDCD